MMGVGYQERTADSRSVADLFSQVTNGLSKLLRQEIDLAKTEMTQKASAAGKDAGMIAGGGLVAYAGFLSVIAGLVLLIGHVIPLWLSALIVGLLVIGAGYLLIRAGLAAIKKRDLAPNSTVRSMQENAQWMREQVR